jgi:hypothetical protein
LVTLGGVFSTLPLIPSAHATSPEIWQIHLQSAPRRSGVQERTVPHAGALARDERDQVYIADALGRLDLTHARGAVTVSLDTEAVRVRDDQAEVTLVIRPEERGRGGTRIFSNTNTVASARMCASHVKQARERALSLLNGLASQLPPEEQATQNRIQSALRRVSAPVTCAVNADDGCNAGWDGTQLFFHRGNESCRPAAEVADLIHHEYGHLVFDAITGGNSSRSVLYDTSLTEAFADLQSALTFDDSRMGVDFWTQRSRSWLRDIAEKKSRPDDERGTYTRSLTFSSALWRALGDLRESFPRVSLTEWNQALISGLILVEANPSVVSSSRTDALDRASLGFIQALAQQGRLPTAQKQAAACRVRAIFQQHGYLSVDQARFKATLGCEPDITLSVRNGILQLEGAAERAQGYRVRTQVRGEIRERTIDAATLGTLTSSEGRLISDEALQLSPANTPCGQRLSGRVSLLDPSGVVVDSHESTWVVGQTRAQRTLSITLQDSGANLEIPESPRTGVRGEWATLPLSIPRLSDRDQIVSVTLKPGIDHFFPDDVVIAWAPSRSRLTAAYEFFKGEEEIALPRTLELPARIVDWITSGRTSSPGVLAFGDVGHMFVGSVRGAELEIQVTSLSCSRPNH